VGLDDTVEESSQTMTSPQPLGVHLMGDLIAGGLAESDASAVAADVDKRLRWFAALSKTDRRAAVTPFLEEVAGYDPQNVSWHIRAATSVIVRSSLIERFHVRHHLGDQVLRAVTVGAAQLLHDHLPPAPETSTGHLAASGHRFPVAWAALGALSESHTTSRQVQFDVPTSWRPVSLPARKQIVFAPRNAQGASVLSAIDPRFDATFVDFLRTGRGSPLVIASLSRLSRSLEKIAHSVELVLSRRMAIVTANATIHPDGWADTRRGYLVQPAPRDPFGALKDTVGFKGENLLFRQSLHI